MARKRIIAHFMHERQQAAAEQAIDEPELTESFVVGDIDEEKIAGLEAEGVVVEIVPDVDAPGRVETIGGPSDRFLGTFRQPFRRLEMDSDYQPGLPDDPEYWIVRLAGPLLDKWREELEALEVELLEYLPRFSYTARMSPDQASQVTQLSFVTRVGPYGPDETGPNVLLPHAALPRDRDWVEAPGPRVITWDLKLHRAEDRLDVVAWLKERRVEVADSRGRKVRLHLQADSPVAKDISALPAVAGMNEYSPPRLHNDRAQQLVGLDRSNPGASVSETGAGQIVAVADTGLDQAHPDFTNRIASVIALGRPGNSSDPHGHGTHVAGTVLGDGQASGGKYQGAAPGAKLYFQSLLDAHGGLGGLPFSLDMLFEPAYDAGARIHNNSWGAATRSVYTADSTEVDEFVANHRDMLIVISAGNEGQARDREHSDPGFVDWLSVGSPASCKNALTVGASRTDRTSGGLSKATYGVAWPLDFPDPPIAAELVSGSAEGLAGFSSRGPVDDQRIKPDIVAPGTDIISARSSTAPLRHFWGAVPGNPQYAFMGGTSMSAPLVAGCAALVREYYVKRPHEPSAALLKATLINGARWLGGLDAVADGQVDDPNFHQGFGCLNMATTIPGQNGAFQLEFVDPWRHGQDHLDASQRHRFTFDCDGGDSLNVCLVWTDLPARGLQNNLDLTLEHTGNNTTWLGNADLPIALTRKDTVNNVEVVRRENPATGEYLIDIVASNLMRNGQDYALVVTGNVRNLKRSPNV